MKPLSNTSAVGYTMSDTPTPRTISVAWKFMNKEICENICRALLDYESERPVQVVDLIDNQLDPQHTQQICAAMESSEVRDVLFRFNDIGKEGCDALANVVNASTKIQFLDIRGNQVACGDVRKLMKAIMTSTSITKLGLSKNKLGPEGTALLCKSLEKNSYVTSVDISENEIGPAGAESIAGLLAKPASTLKSLQMYGNYLGPVGIKHICSVMRKNKEVKTLLLGNNNATDESAEDIALMLRDNEKLEELDLRLNSITATGMKTIVNEGLRHNKFITSLILAGNPIGSVGVDELAKGLISHQRCMIANLDLSSCDLGPTGGMRIAAIIGTSIALQEVNLNDNKLDDEAAISLSKNIAESISLLRVDLSCNSIKENGAKKLIDAAMLNPRLLSMSLHGNDINRVVQKKIDGLLEERIARNCTQAQKSVTTRNDTTFV